MERKNLEERFTEAELKQELYCRKRQRRWKQWRQFDKTNSVTQVAWKSTASPTDSNISDQLNNDDLFRDRPLRSRISAGWIADRYVLLIEVAIAFIFIVLVSNVWLSRSQLNQNMAQIQREQSLSASLPTPTAAPLIDVVILPGGHRPPIIGQEAQPGEAGDIPTHLLPIIDAYQPPSIPTPYPEQARRIQIPAIDVDSPVVQGMYDWEQLKKGAAQKIGSAVPGQTGNTALAGHNDIYGEVFRDLDKLSPGDEIIISTQAESYTYIVRETRIVEPTETWVLNPTDFAMTTLISCYPYRVNTQRIVVFADLMET